MRCYQLMTTAVWVVVGLGTPAVYADPPVFTIPHGMLRVAAEEGKLIGAGGAVDFLSGQTTVNAAGQVILFHDVGEGQKSINGEPLLGGIADRTVVDIDDQTGAFIIGAATADSKVLLTDDPGFVTDAGEPGTFADEYADYLLRVHFVGSLHYFGADSTAWTEPVGGEQLRAFDLSEKDNPFQDDVGVTDRVPMGDLEAVYDATSVGDHGTFNLDIQSPDANLHAHVGYELAVPDGDDDPTNNTQAPQKGAYMIEIRMSAINIGTVFDPPQPEDPVLQDSDPIFFVFNNQLGAGDFDRAVAAAEALPEPSTAAILVGLGAAVIGLRRRNRAPGCEDSSY